MKQFLKCCLCCDKTFESKLAFSAHLSNVLANLSCPVCNNKWSSLAHLIEHLNLDECQPDSGVNGNLVDINDSSPQILNPCSLLKSYDVDENVEDPDCSESKYTVSADTSANTMVTDDGNVYIEILEKDKASMPTQELKLVSGDGDIEQFVIMSTGGTNLNLGNGVVTKQNSDGTISLETTSGSPTETVIAPSENEREDNQEELYSCNTCGVSFSSVLEHIQNYHNDQEVVVEESFDDEELGIEYDNFEAEGIIKQEAPKRVITDNGDIVDATVVGDSSVAESDADSTSIKTEEVEKHNRQQKVDKKCDNVVKNVKKQESSGPFHKVILKEMLMSGESVKTYFCTSCNVYVSNLDDFKNQPCKVLADADSASVKSEVVEKLNRPQEKRYVQIDKFCDSVVKNIKQQENGVPYHKVIVKEIAMSGGENVKTYYCMSCNIYVGNLDDFKNQPCKVFKYPCPHCPVAYENSKSLCAHMKVHKAKPETILPPVSSENFECEICNTLFQTNKSLKLHKRMHDPIKSRPIDPPIETSEGTEGSSGRYHCNICDKLIPVDYRTIHQNSHKANDQLNCGICNKKFHSNEYLEMHMSVHNLDKVPANKADKSLPYCCLYCERRFARPHEKVKHERIHTGEKPHSCEICGKSFRVAYCLTLHMRTHTGARPYACPLCGKRFKAHSVYNHHLLTHSEVRRYKCPYCPKAFKTSVQLAGHKNSHTKPFSCTHCNRPFASLYAVRVHTETHARQNNLKFSCVLCGASYARAFALKDHVKQVHQQDIDALNAASDQTQTNLPKEQDDWTMKENSENDVEIQTMDDKVMTPEINELEMATDQL